MQSMNRSKHISDEELQAKTPEFKKRISEAVADNEARQKEIRIELEKEISEVPVGGDGQAARCQ